jgi:integrator complex subunit 7
MGFQVPQEIIDIFEQVFSVTDHWTQYRIARSASRYGHHYIAGKIYQKLASHVSLEKFHFFLSALTQVSKAECVLLYGCEFEELEKIYPSWSEANDEDRMNLIQRLEKSIAYYWKALANLKATSSPANSLTFQTEFVKLRGQFLEALLNVVIARNTQYITPPPAIAQQLAQNSRDSFQKFGHITSQLRKFVKSIKLCEDNYCKLYKSVFDADPCSLEHLEM